MRVIISIIINMESKYFCTKDNVRATVYKYGVAVVPNVLSEQEIEEMRNGMFSYLENLTQDFEVPIDRNDPKTYKEFFKILPNRGMLMQYWQIGHAQFVWNLRQNPKIAEIFAKIWYCKPEELLVSFDGASFHFPPEIANRGKFREFWYHTDQSYTRPDFECIQSWVTAYDVNEGDATLVFIEGSNRYHNDFAEEFNITNTSDWNPLNDEDVLYYTEELGLTEAKIICPAGSMVFWDSRTIHCGVQSSKYRTEQNFRNVVYICMTPREKATEAVLLKKQKAVSELRMTNHWAHRPNLFPKYPHTYGEDLPDVREITEQPELSELGKKLAGY